MQPLMLVEHIARIPGRPVAVLGVLSGQVDVGQRVRLLLGEVEITAEVVELSFGFHYTPPQRAQPGVEAAVHLAGSEVGRLDGVGWQMLESDA